MGQNGGYRKGSRADTLVRALLALPTPIRMIFASRVRRSLGTFLVAASVVGFTGMAAPDKADGQSRAPTVERIVFLGLSAGDSTYFRGEAVRVRVAFTKHIVATTTNGKPYVELTVGTTIRRARLVASKLNRLDFSYTVQSDDTDADGVSVAADALKLNGAVIKAKDDGTTDAIIAHAAVAGGAARKVDGSKFRSPSIRRVAFAGLPPDGDTYFYNQEIRVQVVFNRRVVVDTAGGTPQLELTIGTTRRRADIDASRTRARTGLEFTYTVQPADLDSDGTSIAANALTLNGGAIKASIDTATAAELTHAPVGAATTQKVDGRPRIVRMEFFASPLYSAPPNAVYKLGELFWIRAHFDQMLTKTGQPRVPLVVGTDTLQVAARPALGPQRRMVVFPFAVPPGVKDPDGVSIPSGSLDLNGGTLKAADGITNARLNHNGLAADADFKVDGNLTPTPRVRVSLANSSPANGETFTRGEKIQLRAIFHKQVVVTGKPQLELKIGTQTRRLAAKSSNSWGPTFEYVVQAEDRDADGISVPANALSAPRGVTIRALADNSVAADLSHDSVPTDPSRKVDGSRTEAPRVQSIVFSPNSATDSTYTRHERFYVNVRFDRDVAVAKTTGGPRLALTIGGSTRYATYAYSSATEPSLQVFTYVVQQTDRDTDGISIAANSLSANGATITLASDTVAADLSHDPVPADLARKVDGSRTSSPRVRWMWFNAPPSGTTYLRGDRIEVTVSFDRDVAVDTTSGRPYVEVGIGTNKRRAAFLHQHVLRTQMSFAYVVQQSDLDEDGIGIAANALSTNGGSITGKDDEALAVLTHDSLPTSDLRKVDGRVVGPPRVRWIEFGRNPSNDSTYTRHERFYMLVVFDRDVAVTTTNGLPRLALTIGDSTRYAAYAYPLGGRPSVQMFKYVVQQTDRDADGISIAANSLSANGASITLAGDTVAADLSHAAVPADLARKMDGGRTSSPRVQWIWLNTPVSDSTYLRGDQIEVVAGFDRAVAVDTTSGKPYVEIGIGAHSRRAAFLRQPSDKTKVNFGYVVQASDRDSTGIGIAANAMSANGGSIALVNAPNVSAVLAHDALPASASRKVDGRTARVPRVRKVDISPKPASDSTYTRHERFYVNVHFDREVTVTTTNGRPRIALTIGESTRYATYAYPYYYEPSIQIFTYLVQQTDRDADGISIAADALSANGGLITLAGDTVAAELSHDPVPADSALKMDGSRTRSPRVRWLWVAPPASGDTYVRGNQIQVTMAFDHDMVVDTTGGKPYVEIDIGAHKRRAAFLYQHSNKSEMSFGYVVQQADRDADGISIAADALSANGGSITLLGVPTVPAVLAHDSVPASALHKVDGSRTSGSGGPEANRAPEVAAPMEPKTIEIGSEPAAEDLSPHFRDPDGDELVYSAVSAAKEVAEVVVAGDALTIRPRAVGQSIVTVRATDPSGAQAEQDFLLTVETSRSDRARIMKRSLAAFGRAVGAETVDAISGRLGTGNRPRPLGDAHLELGGRSVSCDATPGGDGCGLAGLARQASWLLGLRTSPGAGRLASALRAATRGGIGADAARELASVFGPDRSVLANGARRDADAGWGRLVSLDPMSRRELLSRASFRFSPGGGTQGSATGWTFWGRTGAGGFKERPDDDLALDGAVRSAYVGADYRFGSGPLVGLALSRTTSAVGFESGINGQGTVDARLTGVHPYVQWSPRPGLSVWGLLGAGLGSAEVSEDATGERFDASLRMAVTAAGARQQVVGVLAFKADAFAVRTSAGETGDLTGVAASAQRLRLAPEVVGSWAASAQSTIRSRFELGMRFDGGDAETGIGAEAGAELAYAHESIGLTVGAHGRMLVAHQAKSFEDWGASVSVRLQPSREEGGLSFKLEPTWGNAASRMDKLWRDGTFGGPKAVRPPPSRFEVDASYAVVLRDFGQIAPFGRWTTEGDAGRHVNVGFRLSLLDAADGPASGFQATVDLFGVQASGGTKPASRRFGVQGAVHFR